MHLLAHLLAASASCSLVWAQSIQQATPPVEGYTYIGCYTDSAASRGLTDNSQDNPQSNDATACAAFCGGSTYFGLEFSSQCFCGNTLGPTSVQANEGNCIDYSCPGDDNYYCGGFNFFAVYKVNEATGSTPAAPATVTQSATCAAASISTVTVTLTPSVATTSKSPYTTVTLSSLTFTPRRYYDGHDYENGHVGGPELTPYLNFVRQSNFDSQTR